MKKREALKLMTAGGLGLGLSGTNQAANLPVQNPDLKGNIKHSACRWCYNGIELDVFCREAKNIGLVGIDLLGPNDWQTAFDAGLTCTMAMPAIQLPDCFNDPKNHEALLKEYTSIIPKAAEAGLKNIICFSGNRNGLSDEQGLENCAVGLDPVMKIAEKHDVMIQMELLNSKVDHADYQCDNSPWGIALCEKIGSPNFKLLYDIYHMQIMEGDIIATIRKYNQYFGHYHTGGVPGRNEIDERQELYYPRIMQAIVETGFEGFVAQEFIPRDEDPLKSLADSIAICDV